MAKLREELTKVAGRHDTEVLHMDAVSGEPDLQVLIVPGNPGQARYYVPFMASLHSLMSGRATITAISHVGMASRQRNSAEVLTLDEQIDHKVSYIQENLLGDGRPPVVILAHSIGTYMSIHAVHRLESRGGSGSGSGSSSSSSSSTESSASFDGELLSGTGESSSGVAKVIGLFPFLTGNPSCSEQARIHQLTRLYGLLARLAWLMQRLPPSSQRWLLERVVPGMEEHAAETTLSILTPTSVRSSLFMAKCEFETLAAPADWWLLRKLGPRFAALGTDRDIWCPEWKWRQMLQEVPGMQAVWEESFSHAFCISKKQSHAVAKRVVGLIQGPGTISKL